MKKLLLLLSVFLLLGNAFAQHFFDTDFNSRKKYIILCDPTVNHIKTIKYLADNNILKLNKNKVNFVGVYYQGQKTDYTETQNYINENKFQNFYLHEITGELNETNLYRKNAVTHQLKKVFDNSIGVIFFGGADIPPTIYGEENTKSGVYTPARHYYEANLSPSLPSAPIMW
jgi:putative glutamine amidotransferase